MPITLTEFKRAFAGKLEKDGGLKRRDRSFAKALKRFEKSLGAIMRPDGSTDGFKAEFDRLVECYKAARKQSVGSTSNTAAQLDEVLYRTDQVIGEVEEAAAGAGPPPPSEMPDIPDASGPESPADLTQPSAAEDVTSAKPPQKPENAPADGSAAGGAARHTAQVLKVGARGPAVSVLQEQLKSGLKVDGIFGPKTQTAVIKFQKKAGVKVDGVVGPDTWDALLDSGADGINIDDAVAKARELQSQFEQATDAAQKGKLARELLAISKRLERRLGKAAKDGSGLPKLTGQIQWDANSPLAGTLVDIAPFGAGDLWTSASAAAPQPKPPKKPPGKKPSPAGTGTLPIGILVTDSKTYNRIKGAKVRLGTVTKRTNESGHAEFDVAEGAYACEVSADGYGGKTETVKARTATDEFEFALDPVSEKQSAAGDDTVQVDIVVVEPDEASQKNNAILGTPIKRATVELVAGAKTYKKGANTTGQVSFRVPPGSDVKCKASAAGYETAEKTFYVPHDGPRSFDIQLKRTPIADPVADQWWETDEGYVPLIVDVREFEGAAKPIQGAIVRIDADPFLTDGEGRVTRDLSVQSTWEYEISAPGYKTEKGTFEITDKRKHLEVFLARTAKTVTTGDMVVVQVVVHNRLGDMLTVKNAVVTVGRVSRKTDSSGMATFSVPPGVHEFAVRMKGYSDETGKFDVPTSKDAITQRIAITPSTKPVENICVRVREAGTHTPVVKAAVRISSQQESTDAQGVARFLEMPLGALDLAVAAAGYKTHSRTFHHNRQFATEFLEIELEPDRATGASPKPMEPRE